MKNAAEGTLKKVTLELGGKSPLIIFDDCNLEKAVSVALMANFYTQGEVCTNGTRVFVQNGVHEEFVRKCVERIKKMRIGNPLNPETNIGALISSPHLKKVLTAIEEGKREGAILKVGGNQLNISGGFFIEPTLFDQCQDHMKIVKEEIFGPVMSVLPFETEEEVIKRANDTKFGLASGVFTSSLQRAHRVVAQLQSGMCWVNNYNLTPVEIPFGGYKDSGIGKENGTEALEHYTQLKTVYVEMDNDITTVF